MYFSICFITRFISVVTCHAGSGKVYEICYMLLGSFSGLYRFRLLALPSFAFYGAEFGGEFHQLLYRELTEGFAGDSWVSAEIVYLRPIGRINFKFLHQLECDTPATLEFISRPIHPLDGDAEVSVFLPGHFLEGVGASGSVLQHKLTLCLVRLSMNSEFVKGGVKPPEVSYLLCHIIDRFC